MSWMTPWFAQRNVDALIKLQRNFAVHIVIGLWKEPPRQALSVLKKMAQHVLII
jgi:hypothetical protein